MALTVADFWKLLVQSGLLTQEQCQPLSVEFGALPGAATAQGKKLAEWLVKKNILSKYQAIILLAGRAGPFFYGDYKIYDRLDSGRLSGSFRAVHVVTNHPVMLRFVASGSPAQSPELWGEMRNWVPITAHPQIARCYEAVDLGSYKFQVFEDLRGQSVAELLAQSTRLPVAEASRIARLAAQALSHLHEHGRAHGDVRPHNLWIREDGGVKILVDPEFGTRSFNLLTAGNETDGLERADYAAPEFLQPGRPADPLVDIYALGCSLYQLIAGQPPFPGGDVHSKLHRHATEAIRPLDFAGAPPPFTQLVAYSMAKNPAVRFQQARMLADQLLPFLDAAHRGDRPAQPSTTLAPFEMALHQRQALAAVTQAPVRTVAAVPVVAVPTAAAFHPAIVVHPAAAGVSVASRPAAVVVAPVSVPASVSPVATSAATASSAVAETIRRRVKAKQRNNLLFLAVSVLAMCGAIGAVVVMMNRATTPAGGDSSGAGAVANPAFAPPSGGPPVVAANSVRSTAASAEIVDGPGSNVGSDADLVSTSVVQDDGQTLWQSPTNGTAIDLQYVPPGAQLFLIVRPAALLADPEGARVWKTLGPRFESGCRAWEAVSGVALADVEQLIVALFANQGQPPRAAYVLHLKSDAVVEDLRTKWGSVAPVDGLEHTVQKDGWAYYTPSADRKVIVMGPLDPEIKDAAEAGWKAPLLRREVGQLLQVSDNQRHATILFAPNFLFGDGQELFAGDLTRALRPLEWFLGTGLKAGLLSVHLGDHFYLELRMESDIQTDRYQLASLVRERIAGIPGSIESYIAALNPHPYWRLVAFRYPAMIRFLYQHTRIGVDGSHAMLNSVLPDQAAHNLIFGGEMVLASAPGVVQVNEPSASAAAIPKTIDELMAAKISIGFAQDSLEFAMQNIVAEAKSSYPNLPFDFQIKILGSDLEKDGITRNQQVRDFNHKDKSVAEVLTAMVTKANPVTTVKAPHELDQKLLWVLAPSPDDPALKIVVITTRTAAANAKYTLPQVFQPK